MKLEDKEIQLVLTLCDKVQVGGLQAMSEILMLAGKCQRAIKDGGKVAEPPQDEVGK